MPRLFTVGLSTDNITYTALTNVQEVSINIGRQRQLDAYNATRATITLRYPNGYATPVANLVSGTFVQIQTGPSNTFVMNGIIDNVDVQYGIPFADNVGNADFVSFTVEGSFAKFGRVQGDNYSLPAGTLTTQIADCATQTGLSIIVDQGTAQMAATTIDDTWGQWLQKVLVTINGRMWDGLNQQVTIRTPIQDYVLPYSFSDTTNNATNQVYDQINFGSYADNYYTQVTVTPESFSAATVQSGVAPFRTLQTNTLNASTSQATDFANYLLNNYNEKSFALLSISCMAEAQTSFAMDYKLTSLPGISTQVTFRGTTFNCIIEGVSVTATPESSRYTFYLSGADLNSYLILDNAVFGRLDYNKLGF
mgnify:CR=1 FL=1